MMVLKSDNILKGIQSAAIGKTGSRHLSAELSHAIYDDINNKLVDPIHISTLFTALYYKGFSESETILKKIIPVDFFTNFHVALNFLIQGSIDNNFYNLLYILIQNKHLSLSQTEQLGDYLFDSSTHNKIEYDCAKIIAAILLRVRYSIEDEYAGLYNAFIKTIHSNFKHQIQLNHQNIIQISEPFDGLEHNYLLTPIISNYFIKQNYRVVALAGESSGPKYGCNLFNLANSLNLHFLKSNIDTNPSEYGEYINLEDVSPAWKYWVGLRKKMVKRPFMATLERFPNLINATINITCAFHEPFSAKMLSLSEHANYPGNIVIRKGREGSLAFSLSKSVDIQCSARQKDGTYKQHSFVYSLEDINLPLEEDGRYEVNVTDNKNIIEQYVAYSTVGDSKINNRIKVTLSGLQKAVDWTINNIEE